MRKVTLVVRKLATFRRSLFASPDYIIKHGAPIHPHDLINHQCIASGDRHLWRRWILTCGDQAETVAVSGPVAVESLIIAPGLAINGLGIASAATRSLEEEIASGALVRVLPDWEFEPLHYSALTTSKLLPAKTRLFIDYLAMRMKLLAAQIG